MPYFVSAVPYELEDLVRWLEDELSTVDQAVTSGRAILNFVPLHAPNPKPQIGNITYADGVDWNPGQGEGLYVYTSTGYQKLNT